MPAKTRFAPLLKASSTSARPIPRLAPVTRTVLPAIVIHPPTSRCPDRPGRQRCGHHDVGKMGAHSPPSSRLGRCRYWNWIRRARDVTRGWSGATDLITRARAGDGDAFRELTEPHRRELLVHCYRMIGSFQDAEDVLQDTLLAAWQGLGGFQERASLRTWLYRIAPNRCLNARRSASRRKAKEWDVPGVEPPEPTRLGEVPWLQPYAGTPFEGAIDASPGPEARYEQTESISLAFVTALQLLPPRQLAVLVLRDVLGFHAKEVADMLDSSVESVTSALKRARVSLQRRWPPAANFRPSAPPAA